MLKPKQKIRHRKGLWIPSGNWYLNRMSRWAHTMRSRKGKNPNKWYSYSLHIKKKKTWSQDRVGISNHETWKDQIVFHNEFIYIYINLCFTLGSCWYKLSQRLRALQLDSFARRHQLFSPFGVWQLTSKDCTVNGCICVKSRDFFISKVTLLSNCFHFSKYVHFKVQPQIHYFSWLHDCIDPRAQGFFVSVTFWNVCEMLGGSYRPLRSLGRIGCRLVLEQSDCNCFVWLFFWV